ncbi:MAG: 3-carboxy-cis,cis-muconate cycloisomerase [Mesorhizobium sp.]|nr:3-carboxy-cis,cis-muconate cycloisomerase [Mesorhizobium sp.]
MTVSPFEHPFLSGLLGDAETAALFSAEADIDCMIAFESALAEAEAAEGIIPADAAKAISHRLPDIEFDMDALRAATARDGVVVPDLVRQMRAAVGPPHGEYVHFGATSQDAVDTSLALRLKLLLATFGDRLDLLVAALHQLDMRDGTTRVMAHTRMQAAIPVTATRKIRSWRDPLMRERTRLTAIAHDHALVAFGGAAGTLDGLGSQADAVTRRMARRLGLRAPDKPRHSERDGMVELASWFAMVTGSLGKMGQDIAIAAQSEVGEVRLASGGGSSAMPHKVNPVDAELLVTLARFNATLVAGMHQAMVHENERSGAAWTLEWMLLPQMATATGTALNAALRLVGNMAFVALEE